MKYVTYISAANGILLSALLKSGGYSVESALESLHTTKLHCETILEIIESVNEEKKKGILHILFDRHVVKEDLLRYAACTKKIIKIFSKEYPLGPDDDKKIKGGNQQLSYRELCTSLNTLAWNMIILAKMHDDNKKESLLLLGATDRNSLLSTIPSELVNNILDKCIQIELENTIMSLNENDYDEE